MSKYYENLCFSDSWLLSTITNVNSLESFLLKYLFPPVFLVGILGNLIDLFVLFSPGMRNRANYLLSALALADLTFLFVMLPHCLANYTTFALNYAFRYFYFHGQHELIAMANWASAAAIWFVLAVCLDRLIGIKTPLYSCKEWTSRRTVLLFVAIVVGTGLLTSYYHFDHECFHWTMCNGTQLHSKCFSVVSDRWLKNGTNPNPQWLRSYVRFGTTLHAVFVIFLPTIVLIGLSVALVRELNKRSNKPLQASHALLCRSGDGAIQRRQERKATVTVCAIVCCFILTQGPSCGLMFWNSFFNEFNRVTDPVLYDISRAGNFLTTIGKSSNFFLFCFISSSFRLRLLNLWTAYKKKSNMLSCFRQRHHRLNSAATNLGTIKSNNGSSPIMTSSCRASVPLLRWSVDPNASPNGQVLTSNLIMKDVETIRRDSRGRFIARNFVRERQKNVIED